MFKLRSTKNVFITEFNENDGTFKAVTNQEGPWSIEYQRIEGGRAVNKQLDGYARSSGICDMYIYLKNNDCNFVKKVTECPGRKRKFLGTFKPGQRITIYPVQDMQRCVGDQYWSYYGCTQYVGDYQYEINAFKCIAQPSLVLPNFKLGNSNDVVPVVTMVHPLNISDLEYTANTIYMWMQSIVLEVNEIPEGIDPLPESYKILFDYTCAGTGKSCGIDYEFSIDYSENLESGFRFDCVGTDEGNSEGPVDTPLGNYDNPPTFYRTAYRRLEYDFNDDIYVGTAKALSEASLPPSAITIALEDLIVPSESLFWMGTNPCLSKFGDCDDLVFTGLWATELMLRRSKYNDDYFKFDGYTWIDDWWIWGYNPSLEFWVPDPTDVAIPEDYEHGLRENATKTAIASGGYAEMIDIIPSLNASSILKINPYLGPVQLVVGLQCIDAEKTALLGKAKLAELKLFPYPWFGKTNFIGRTDEILAPIDVSVNNLYTHTFPEIPRCSDIDPSIDTKVSFEVSSCNIVDYNFETNTITVQLWGDGVYDTEFSIHQHCLCEVPIDPLDPSKTAYSPLGGPNVIRWPGAPNKWTAHQNVWGMAYKPANGPFTGGTTENMRVIEFSPNESITIGPDMTVCSGSRILSIVPGSENNVVVESVNNTNKTIKFKPLAQTFYFIYSVSCGGVETKRYVVYGNNKMPIEVEYNPPV